MLVRVFVLAFSVCAVVSTDDCQSVEVGTNNKQLLFSFIWNYLELKSVTCHKYGTIKGQCRGVNMFVCSLEQPFSGHYNMNSNADLTQVTFTITSFHENRAGEYCCSKESMKESTCQCIKVAEKVTPVPVPSIAILWGMNKRATILATTAVLFYSTF